MDSEKYQGWSNHATWAYNLWLTNTEGDYFSWREEAKACKDIGELAEKMKEALGEIADTLINSPNETTKEQRLMLQDIGDLTDIDYYEVAKAFFDELKEEKKPKKARK